MYVPDAGGQLRLDPKMPVIDITREVLRIGDHEVHDVDFGTNSISWAAAREGSFTSGQLVFAPDGVTCRGFVAFGPSAASASHQAVFASAVPPTSYRTQITRQRHPTGTDPASLPEDAWQPGVELDLGYTLNPATGFPESAVKLDSQDVAIYVSLAVTKDTDLLVLGVDATVERDVVCAVDPSLYTGLKATFSLFGDAFAGEVASTCADAQGSGTYLWRGTALTAVPAEVLARLRAPAAQAARPHRAAAVGDTPSIAELLSLVPDQRVNDTANAMLVENTRWAIAQDPRRASWNPDLFGVQPPALAADRQKLIGQSLDWYQKQFAVSYLTWGLNDVEGPAAPEVTLSSDQRQKLSGFLKRGLGESGDYAKQMHGLYGEAYLTAKRPLAKYLGADWADKLLDAVGSGSLLNNAVGQIVVNHDAGQASGISALLQTLDPSGKAAATYQERLLSKLLLSYSLQTRVTDLDLAMSWLPDALQAFAETYGTKPNAALALAAAAGPRAAGDQDGKPDKTQVADAVRDAAEHLGGWSELAKELAKLMILSKGRTLAQQGEDAAEAFATAYPRLAVAGRAVFFVAWVGGMFNVIVSFLGYEDLSPTEKASTIVDLVGLAGDAAEAAIGVLKRGEAMAAWRKLQGFISSEDAINDFGEVSRSLAEDGEVIGQGARATGDLIDAEAGVLTNGTRWDKVFAAAEKVVAAIGVLLALASTVLSTIDFIHDIMQGKPISKTVIDGLLVATNLAATVSLALDLVIGSTVFAMAASVFAIVGLVLAIIAMFLPEPKAETPATKFMKTYGIPYAEGLQPA